MDAVTAPAAGPSFGDARRIVVKIGSALLVDQTSGQIRRDWLNALADDIAACRAVGQEILLVSSGAIAVGRRHLGLAATATLSLDDKQAAAATGQIRLAHAWQESLARHDITVAQILLTATDTEERRRHLNARSTLAALLRLGAVPVINENDTVATEEIRFGDNDRLAARVAQMISADALVLLSDIDGLYDSDPSAKAGAKLLPVVEALTPEIQAMAGAPRPGDSSGGMVTKLQAARIAYGAGCRMVIADGRSMHPLAALATGGRCTWFLPPAEPLAARKRWIAGSINPLGTLVLDAGAVRALSQGKSLLPAGIAAVEGAFERGDLVLLRGPDGTGVGRGLAGYSSRDADLIKGHKSSDIEARLGYRGRDEMIHRDDLVID